MALKVTQKRSIIGVKPTKEAARVMFPAVASTVALLRGGAAR